MEESKIVRPAFRAPRTRRDAPRASIDLVPKPEPVSTVWVEANEGRRERVLRDDREYAKLHPVEVKEAECALERAKNYIDAMRGAGPTYELINLRYGALSGMPLAHICDAARASTFAMWRADPAMYYAYWKVFGERCVALDVHPAARA